MGPLLERFAPSFRAEPRKVGGSLMRVFRDTRFSRDKTPYKTNIGIQFRQCWARTCMPRASTCMSLPTNASWAPAAGIPRPTPSGEYAIWIAAQPERWFAARDDRKFGVHWTLAGDALTRPPRGHAADHPALEDLKRKDFIALAPLSFDAVTSPGLPKLAGSRFADAAPLMRFVCEALGVPY